MAFKRSAVRSRLSPPKQKGTPKGVLFCFVSILQVEPGAAKQRAVTLRQPPVDNGRTAVSRSEEFFRQPPTSGSKKSAAQSYRLSPPPVRQVLFFCPLKSSGCFLFQSNFYWTYSVI